MRVCLISPPTASEFNERQLGESEAFKIIADHAPMGILSLAAVLEPLGFELQIIDLNRLYYDFLTMSCRRESDDFCTFVSDALQSVSADVFGFSSICSTYPLTIRIARAVRGSHPKTRIIFGGPQASVVDVPTLEAYPFIDCIVRGEAEATLPVLLNKLETGEELDHLKGITYRQAGRVVRNPNAPVIEDLDSLPLPAFHLYPYTRQSTYAPLEAGRGCPFACSFCSTNDFFRRRFRMKSPDLLVEQMKLISQTYDIDTFELIHDMFTVDRRKVFDFCNTILNSGEQFYWSCSARTDCIDDEMISVMRAAGCKGIFFGVDTGSDRMQHIIHKRLNLTDAAARIHRVNTNRVGTTVSLIVGFPEETKSDLRATVNFLGNSLRHEHADVQFHLLAPLAETPVTTQYRDQLVHDDIFSDISFQGWEQHPEERQMIMTHRDIFPNFYGLPTNSWPRERLRELREFILHGTTRHRWLMLMLHRDSGDLLNVFEEWQAWSSRARAIGNIVDTSRSYYTSDKFSNDLFRFVQSAYSAKARYPHLIGTLVEVEKARLDLAKQAVHPRRPANPLILTKGRDLIPNVHANVRIILVAADYKRLMRCLKRNERLADIPIADVALALIGARENVRVLQLSNRSYQLAKFCDGSRNLAQIAAKFSSLAPAGISPFKASLYGVASLAADGVIGITQAVG